MGDETKLLCSRKSSSNNVRDLKDIFLNRFKLSDEFWKDLFHISCPEGLGEVNKKLQNDENLHRSDFQPCGNSSLHHKKSGCEAERQNMHPEFKTPVLRCLSDVSHSPSLFSPAQQDNDADTGPRSSTPLHWKSVKCSGSIPEKSTPASAKRIFNESFKTPMLTKLDHSNNTTITPKLTRSLSATLEMDPADCISWTSSLATPPENAENSSKKILPEACEVLPENNVGSEAQGKQRSSKSVARVLFEKKSQSLEEYPFAGETSFECCSTLDSVAMRNISFLLDSKEENSDGSAKNNAVNTGECVNSFHNDVEMTSRKPEDFADNINDMVRENSSNIPHTSETLFSDDESKTILARTRTDSSLDKNVDYFDASPLQGSVVQAMVELSAMNDISNPCLPEKSSFLDGNDNEHSLRTTVPLKTPQKDPAVNDQVNGDRSVQHDVNHGVKPASECFKCEDQNFYDMDTLSEFPFDYKSPENVAVTGFLNQRNNSNESQETVESQRSSQKDDNRHCFPRNLTNQAVRTSQQGSLLLNGNQGNNIDGQSTKKTFDKSLKLEKNTVKCNLNREYGKQNKSEGQCALLDEQPNTGISKKMETASQILRELSLHHLCDTTYDVDGIVDLALLEAKVNEVSRTPLLSDNVDSVNDVYLNSDTKCDKAAFLSRHKKYTSLAEEFQTSDILTGDTNDAGNDLYNSGKTKQHNLHTKTSFNKDLTDEKGEAGPTHSDINDIFTGLKDDSRALLSLEIKEIEEILKEENETVVSFCTCPNVRGYNAFGPKKTFHNAEGDLVGKMEQCEGDLCYERVYPPKNCDAVSLLVSEESPNKIETSVNGVIPQKYVKICKEVTVVGVNKRNMFGLDASSAFSTISGKVSGKIQKKVCENIIFGYSEQFVQILNDIGDDVNDELRISESTCFELSALEDNVNIREGFSKNLTNLEKISGCTNRVRKDESSVNENCNFNIVSPSSKKGSVTDASGNQDSMIENYRNCDTNNLGKQAIFSDVSLRESRNVLNYGKKTDVGFSTMSGKKVLVCKESSKEANEISNGVNKKEKNELKSGYAEDKRKIGTNKIGNKRNVEGKVAERPNIGFSMATDNQIVVFEPIKKAKEIINEVDQHEKNKLKDCQIDNRKENVKEQNKIENLKMFSDVGKSTLVQHKRSDEKSFIGFSTASGKKVNISEKSLKRARGIMNDIDNDDESKKKINVELSISEVSEDHVQQNMNDNVNIFSPVPVSISDASLENSVDNQAVFYKQSSGKICASKDKFSKKSFGQERCLNKDECQGDDKNNVNVFSHASGKELNVSKESIKKAKSISINVGDDEKYKRSSNRYSTSNDSDENLFRQTQTNVYNNKVNIGFSTASGKKVNISKESLNKARAILRDVDNNEKYNKTSRVPFSTAKESEDSSKKAQENVNDSVDIAFSTASGKKINISEESLNKARAILENVDDEKCNENSGIWFSDPRDLEDPIRNAQVKNVDNDNVHIGFSIASGTKVRVSDKSLGKGRAILNDVDNNKKCKEQVNIDFSTQKSRFKQKKCIKKVYREKGNEFQKGKDSVYSIGFSTASGKKVNISDESLNKARAILNEVGNEKFQKTNNAEFSTPKISVGPHKQNNIDSVGIGFSTASGRKVHVSNDSLRKARAILKSVDNGEELKQDNDEVSTSEVKESFEKSRRNHGDDIVTLGFSTASGKKVHVSDESLKKARNILNDVDKEENGTCDDIRGFYKIPEFNGTNNEKRYCDTLSIGNVNKWQSEKIADETIRTAFSRASGGSISVSDELRDKARVIINEVDCNEMFEKLNSELTDNGSKNFGFSTASGKKVVESEESSSKASRLVESADIDNESKGVSNIKGKNQSETFGMKSNRSFNNTLMNENNVTNCSRERKVKNKSEFSMASEKDVNVSDEALKRTRRVLDELSDCESITTKKNKDRDKIAVFSASLGQKALELSTLDNAINNENRGQETEMSNNGISGTSTLSFAGLSSTAYIPNTSSSSAIRNTPTNCIENKENVTDLNFEDMSEKTCDEVRESTKLLLNDESFVDLSQFIGGNKNQKRKEICSSKLESLQKNSFKRQSFETEIEYVRPCKSSRKELDLSDVVNKGVLSMKKGVRSSMTAYNSDPLEVYCDRKYSQFRSPIKAVVVTPDYNNFSLRAQCTESGSFVTPCRAKPNKNREQLNCSKSNGLMKRKSTTHFTTPYRASANAEKPDGSTHQNQNSALSGHNRTKSRNSGSAEDKRCLTKPHSGSIYTLRNSTALKRIPFSSYVGNNCRTWTSPELLRIGIHPSILSISCENSDSYRFKGCDFMSDKVCQTNSGVRFTDGAVLCLGKDKCCGVEEFADAFLRSPGVDFNLIDQQWIANHYKWIIWKLASYEVTYPIVFLGRCLTPDMVLRQLKYRYDREIDRCERSAIKKILERDDTSSRGMVLCVANTKLLTENAKVKDQSKSTNTTSMPEPKMILMTDGWYSIRVLLDKYLQNLVNRGKIFTGQKLYIQGAELVGSDQAVSPLEAPSNLYLRIHGNSTRPAKKFSRLGFHCKNSIFTLPITSLSSDGGLVSCINVIVARQYPLQFMEKRSDGSSVFRNPRCEERVAKLFEQEVQRKREKVMYQVQVELEKDEIQIKACKRRRKDTLTFEKIQNLYDGKELFDAINNATDPCSVQDALSDEQKTTIDKYKRSFQDNKVVNMRRKYEETWNRLCEEETLERNVVPVLKVKLVDTLPQKKNKTPGTALLTIWRPNENIITILGEGKRLKIYNVHASRYTKGSDNIQLSANRSTIYKELPFEPKYKEIFQARKVYSIIELSNGVKPGVEVDVVAVVISYNVQANLTIVYMTDSDLNFVRLKIWRGLQEQALEDIVKEKTFIASSNLLFQPDKYFGIPSVKYYELSMITANPSNKMLRHKLCELKKGVLDLNSFITKAKSKLNEILSTCATPKSRHTEMSCATPVSATSGDKEVTFQVSNRENDSSVSGKLKQSRKRLLQLKRRKLDLIPTPPPLSPIPNALPDSVRKEFKVPRRVITESKENDISER